MGKTSEEYLFEIYIQEYSKHRDEIQNRINLQNGMAQRGLTITGLAATLLATLFTFFMKDTRSTNTPYNNTDLFVAVCLPVLFLHGVLIQLTLATWIYQLSRIFRMVCYWNWMVINKVEPLIGRSGDAFLWHRKPDPPWDLALDKHIVRYFQPLFLYSLCLFSFLGFPIVLLWKSSQGSLSWIRCFSLWVFPLLALSLLFLAVIHLKVVTWMEKEKENLYSQSTQPEKDTETQPEDKQGR